MEKRILVIEDDPSTSKLVTMALRSAGYQAEVAHSYRAAHRALQDADYQLLLCDLYLGDGTGLDILRETRAKPEPMPLVMFTAQGSVETAVEAMRQGAFDYLAKPFKVDDLLDLVGRALEAEDDETATDPETDERPSLLIGNSPPMVNLYKRIALAARSDSPVLITGETGTGKELVARSLHQFSARNLRPFVPVNCGALTDTLLESELFGHEKGAFTGAVSKRKGLFEQADGGTIFLDEISETTPAFQVRLLRTLQEGEVRPVGGNETRSIDVRIVTASNRPLAELQESDDFRQDLYYRLSVVHLEIPPLRKRVEDIPLLTNHFIKKLSRRLDRSFQLTDEARTLLKQYPWPGNVRELENSVERVAVLKTSSVIAPEDFSFLSREKEEDPALQGLNELDRVERHRIVQALQDAGGNKAEAARRLGIPRKSLYRKARRLTIDLGSFE